MTVAQLKTWIQGKGMSVSGKKKEELIEGIDDFFERKS